MSLANNARAAVAVCAIVIGAAAKDHVDERLKDLTSVFVTGNNQSAEGARKVLQDEKTCLSLAPKAIDADAVLDITVDAQSQGGPIGGMGGRAWIASGTLTLKSGELVWSRSERPTLR
jgi:hypothetical protein